MCGALGAQAWSLCALQLLCPACLQCPNLSISLLNLSPTDPTELSAVLPSWPLPQEAITKTQPCLLIPQTYPYCSNWPQNRFPLLAIAPEATTKAQPCMLKFRRGAFSSGSPVCPVLLQYRYQHFNPGERAEATKAGKPGACLAGRWGGHRPVLFGVLQCTGCTHVASMAAVELRA